MGFLDNSGDIILDAVLTDTGRKRLAEGNGSFQIRKFALGDDEINYGLYDKNHVSGTAYYDLEILQTPVLEAFTNNASSMKSKLMTVSRTNHLYLPILKMYSADSHVTHSSGVHLVAVDQQTIDDSNIDIGAGILNGLADGSGAPFIRIDQGIDNTQSAVTIGLPDELTETQYIVEMDHRLGTLTDTDGNQKTYSFIDDDNIATYYLTLGTDSEMISTIGNSSTTPSAIVGARGTKLEFSIKASEQLRTSTFLFEQIGLSSEVSVDGTNCNAIDTNIHIIGATTGYSINVPVRYIKKA